MLGAIRLSTAIPPGPVSLATHTSTRGTGALRGLAWLWEREQPYPLHKCPQPSPWLLACYIAATYPGAGNSHGRAQAGLGA